MRARILDALGSLAACAVVFVPCVLALTHIGTKRRYEYETEWNAAALGIFISGTAIIATLWRLFFGSYPASK